MIDKIMNFRYFIFLITGLVLLIGMSACSNSQEKSHDKGEKQDSSVVLDSSIPSLVTETERHEISVEFPGQLIPRKKAQVSPQVMGYITGIFYDVGDPVNNGDILYTIDSTSIDAQIRMARAGLSEAEAARIQAEAGISQAESNRNLAKLTHERMKNLLEEKSISQHQYDQAENALEMAEAGVTQAQSKVKQVDAKITQAKEQIVQASTMKNYTTVRTPLDGVVSMRWMDPGELAAPGHPVVEIISGDNLRFEFEIRESLLETITDSESIRVVLDAYPGKEYDAQIAHVVPRSNPGSHTFTIRVDLEKYSEPLIAGLYGKLHLTTGFEDVIVVPSSAIDSRLGGENPGVWVVVENKVYFRPVELKKTGESEYIVLNGLEAGERYLAKADGDVVDGAVLKEELNNDR